MAGMTRPYLRTVSRDSFRGPLREEERGMGVLERHIREKNEARNKVELQEEQTVPCSPVLGFPRDFGHARARHGFFGEACKVMWVEGKEWG